jgi:hypothetical protein
VPVPVTGRRGLSAETSPAIEGLTPPEIGHLLDVAENYVLLNRSGKTQRDLLRGHTLINTAATPDVMHCGLLVVRHGRSGVPNMI